MQGAAQALGGRGEAKAVTVKKDLLGVGGCNNGIGKAEA
jgi:hypothetical protein